MFSLQTYTELETRLWSPKFDRYVSMDGRKALLHDVRAIAHWIEVPPEVTAQAFCRDPDDDKFIHAAMAAQAPWLVTGDQDLLAVTALPGLLVLSPAAALRRMEAGR